MTTPNAELAYAVLDHIDAHPEQWQQSTWMHKTDCGTAACFAGWACFLSGEKPGDDELLGITLSTGVPIPDRAEQLLGASRFVYSLVDGELEDEDLFGEFNTREDLGRLVAEIFGPRPEHCGYSLDHPAHDWTRLANDELPFDQAAACPGGAA